MTSESPLSLQLCDELVAVFPNAEYGPAHIVVSDNNLEDEHIISCLKEVDLQIKRVCDNAGVDPTAWGLFTVEPAMSFGRHRLPTLNCK